MEDLLVCRVCWCADHLIRMGLPEVFDMVEYHSGEVLTPAEISHMCRNSSISDDGIEPGIFVHGDPPEDEESSALVQLNHMGL